MRLSVIVIGMLTVIISVATRPSCVPARMVIREMGNLFVATTMNVQMIGTTFVQLPKKEAHVLTMTCLKNTRVCVDLATSPTPMAFTRFMVQRNVSQQTCVLQDPTHVIAIMAYA